MSLPIRVASRAVTSASRHTTLTSRIAARSLSASVHDNDPEVLEKEKHRNLSKSQHSSAPHDHAPGWNEYLASTSEANLKADQSTGTLAEMQSRTVEQTKKRYTETEIDGQGEKVVNKTTETVKEVLHQGP